MLTGCNTTGGGDWIYVANRMTLYNSCYEFIQADSNEYQKNVFLGGGEIVFRKSRWNRVLNKSWLKIPLNDTVYVLNGVHFAVSCLPSNSALSYEEIFTLLSLQGIDMYTLFVSPIRGYVRLYQVILRRFRCLKLLISTPASYVTGAGVDSRLQRTVSLVHYLIIHVVFLSISR
jgi:hypothetical protein